MDNRPFNIRILVAEGIPDGFRLIEKPNWVGLGLICPRNRYSEVKERDEFSKSGVYILIGAEPKNDEVRIYIGQGEVIRNRLDDHNANKEFWEKVIVFTAKNNMLHKAHTKYLEARLLKMARENKRCNMENENLSNLPSISEFDEADIAEYLEEMLLLLPVIGIDIFTKAEEKKKINKNIRYSFVDDKNRWNANGYETSSGFAVEKDSIANGETTDSLYPKYRQIREQLIKNGVIKENDEELIFVIDYEFDSPSQAACVVAGRSANGRTDWKDEDQVTLKENQGG